MTRDNFVLVSLVFAVVWQTTLEAKGEAIIIMPYMQFGALDKRFLNVCHPHISSFSKGHKKFR